MEIVTTWNNQVNGIHDTEGVSNWLKANILAITGDTQMRIKMRIDDPKKIGMLVVDLNLDPADITSIETQFPELVGKIT